MLRISLRGKMKNLILLIVAFSMFIDSVDATIINTAIPSMAHSLQVNPIDLKIALISYLMSLAIFIPISGWIADKFGVKKIFISALGLFTLSSIWCALSNSLPELICARVLQGIGGSLTMPVGRLIIIRTCERSELISKMSIVVMVAAMGLMLGPVLGGIITTHTTWRWIFWVNVPIGILTMILAGKYFPLMPARPVPPLDKLGFVLFGTGLASLTFGLSLLSESNVYNSYAFLTIAVSILLLISYIFHSRKNSHPIVNVALLQQRTFRTSVTGNILSRIGFGGIPFLLPLLLQIVLGYSPQLSGFLLAPTALGVLLVKPLSLHVLRLVGYKNLLIFNTFLVGFALLTFATINSQTSIYAIGLFTFVYGFLISLQYTAMNSLAYANVSAEDVSSATSIMSTIQQLAQSFGVAIAALLIRIFSGNGQVQTELTVRVFHDVFIAMGIVTFFSAVIFIYLKPDDGHELTDEPVKKPA
jgi:EmrB/QacA subfamily drug resistance transporter